MKYLNVLMFVIFANIFIGCMGAPEEQEYETSFIQSEYDPYGMPGTSEINGQAFLKTKGGDVKYGAGGTVYLTPVTTISTEFFIKYVLNGIPLKNIDTRSKKYSKSTTADGNGNFEFTNLAAGEYYIFCNIEWQYYSGKGNKTTGGIAYAKVKVGEGRIVKAVVTR